MELDEIKKRVRCGGCGGRIGRRLNMMELDLRATWDYPSSANVLTGDNGRAVAMLCDRCIKQKVAPREAVEFCAGEIVYHGIDTLEKLPPPRRPIKWFRNSPEEGFDCFCSWCEQPIVEPDDETEIDDADNQEWPAIRMWKGEGKNCLEARFHPRCLNEAIEAGCLTMGRTQRAD